MAQGLIEYVGEDCVNALYQAIEARSIRPGICKTAGLKLVYSPLNGSGLVPVTHVLGDIGITDITIVPEQKNPDGNFPTCPYPNPEIKEAMALGCDRLLTSGHESDAFKGRFFIAELVERAAGRIIVMPGCGVRRSNIARIAADTGAVEFHASSAFFD